MRNAMLIWLFAILSMMTVSNLLNPGPTETWKHIIVIVVGVIASFFCAALLHFAGKPFKNNKG